MNKTDLIQFVANDAGFSKSEASKAVDSILKAIHETLTEGNTIALAGFGTFQVTDRAARTGRNPKTLEPIEIKATKVVKFKPGKALKEAVAG